MTEQKLEELIEKYAGETASEEEIRQLMHWYHSVAVSNLQWPGKKEDVYQKMLQRLQLDIKPKQAKVLVFPWQNIAAALVLLLGAALLVFQLTKPSKTSYIAVKNPAGKIKQVVLPDKTNVWLNAATELQYATSFVKNRNVKLNGEAYFEVTHNASYPFTISAGELKTTVLGTSFNIKAYETESNAVVSVISGSVEVANTQKNLAVLKPTMQLQFDKKHLKAKIVAIDTNSVLAWKRGALKFEGESLASIAQILERWYGINIIFSNPLMMSCRYYMSFDNKTPLEKTLSTIAELTGIQYSIDNNTVTLSGKGC